MLRQFLDKWNDYSDFSLSSCSINVSKTFLSGPLIRSIRVLSDGPFLNLNWLTNCVKCLCEYITYIGLRTRTLNETLTCVGYGPYCLSVGVRGITRGTTRGTVRIVRSNIVSLSSFMFIVVVCVSSLTNDVYI